MNVTVRKWLEMSMEERTDYLHTMAFLQQLKKDLRGLEK